MNAKSLITLLGLVPCCFVSAQIVTNFTSGEGYADGPLGNNADWNVFDGSGVDANAYTVDVSGSGSLIIDPTEGAFQAASYIGSGSPFTSNTYYGQSTFTLDYTNGTTSVIPGGALALPNFEIQNAADGNESVAFALRQVSASGTDGNRFNLYSFNKFNGANDVGGNFSDVISGSDLGLAIDGSGIWTDGQSDTLALAFTLVHGGSNEWTESVTLTNVDTATEIISLSRLVTDVDGSFAANDNRFRIWAPNVASMDVAIKMDSLSLEVVPEPATYALLAGFCAIVLVFLRRRR